MNDDEMIARALADWPAAEPPAGFAERVLSARGAHRDGARRFRWRLPAMTAAIALIAIAGAMLARGLSASAGQRTVSSRETIELGRRGLAVAESGTRLSWAVSAGGDARISQATGNVFYRVEPGGPFVVTAPGAELTVTGTCFRVEVTPMASLKENARAALAGAAVASAVLVTVYEGRVHVKSGEHAQDAVELRAGEQSRFEGTRAAGTTASAAPPRPPVASAHVDPLSPQQGDNQSATLRARIAELEAEVARLSTAKPKEPAASDPFKKVRGFTADELKQFAEKCELHVGQPAYGLTPPTFDTQAAKELSIAASESDQINQILSAQNGAFIKSMRELYIAVTGDASGADQLDVPAMMNEIISKSPPAAVAAARQEVSLENAGLATPPADPSQETAITRMYRLLNGSGAKLQDALASSLGHADAERVLDALTPLHMVVGGCPADAP